MTARSRTVLRPGILVLAAFAAIQLVPYGRDHTNPPATAEYVWDSAAAKAIAKEVCYDCHSNETVWPWYTHVAPASWLAQRDVDKGRRRLNFSEWTPGSTTVAVALGRAIAAVVAGGEMPPLQYRIVRAGARLSEAERRLLIAEFGASR